MKVFVRTVMCVSALAFALAVSPPAGARDVFPLEEISGTADDWFLSAAGVLRFQEARAILDFDQTFLTPDIYRAVMPKFKVNKPGSPFGSGKQYDLTVDPDNDGSKYLQFFTDGGKEIARFLVKADVDHTLRIPFDTVGSIDALVGMELVLDYVNNDSLAEEGRNGYWVDGFVNYMDPNGADWVVTLNISRPGPGQVGLLQAIEDGLAIEGSEAQARTSASFTMTPIEGIPEPTTIALVGASLLALGLRRRKAA